MVQYLNSKATDGQLCIRDKFLARKYLDSGTGEGLYKYFDEMVDCIGIQDLVEQKLGCDGTNANIADGGLKGTWCRDFP